MHPRILFRLIAAALIASALTPGAAQAAPYAQIEGSGSTWVETIMQQWIFDVDAQGMKLTYNGGGSSQGRKAFAQKVTDFAVTELPYQGIDEFGAVDSAGDRAHAYIPIVGGAVVFAYQLRVGDQLVTDLELSGMTVAKIFTNQITSWDDPAIAADNGGRTFPAIPIIPVVRSDEASTTAVLTTWLDRVYPTVWRPFFGRSGRTSYFPEQSGTRTISTAGSRQVMDTVRDIFSNGTIGYAENSYAQNVRQPVVSVGTSGGRYVSPSNRATWAALRQATVESDGSVNLDSLLESADPDAYPLTYVGHAIVPTGSTEQRMTTAKRQTLVDFMFHSMCEGQRMAAAYGYAPLPLNLVQSGLSQVAELKSADPTVDLAGRDITACQNPTFDPITLSDIPPAIPTVTVGKPTISGLAKVGRTLTVSVSSPHTADASYTFVWNADDSVIPGATDATYVPRPTDVNKLISVTAMPHQRGRVGVPATSDHTVAVVADAVVAGRAAIKKSILKITKTPTHRKAGTARVTLAPASGSPRLSGRTKTVLTLKLGRTTITRRSTVSFVNGAASIRLPKLPKKGHWRASIKVPRSDLVLNSTQSRSVRLMVRR